MTISLDKCEPELKGALFRAVGHVNSSCWQVERATTRAAVRPSGDEK